MPFPRIPAPLHPWKYLTLHKSDHNCNWFRSLDRILCKVSGLVEEHVSMALPSNKGIESLMFFVNTHEKSIGPRAETW